MRDRFKKQTRLLAAAVGVADESLKALASDENLRGVIVVRLAEACDRIEAELAARGPAYRADLAARHFDAMTATLLIARGVVAHDGLTPAGATAVLALLAEVATPPAPSDGRNGLRPGG